MKNLNLLRFIFIISSLLSPDLSVKLKAQGDSIPNPEQFLFIDFSKSIVRLKDGTELALMLNYSIITEKMVFRQKGMLFDMINYGTVDTIYLQNLKFVPAGKVFYQVLINAPLSLFIQHKGLILPPGRPAAYGGTSEVSSSTYMNYIHLGGDAFRMKTKPPINIKPEFLYWVRKNNEMYSFLTDKQLLKIFPEHKSQIRQYMKESLLSTKKQEDVIAIIKYCETLLK